MIEYIYDIIKATSGENIEVAAKVVDEEGQAITEQLYFHLWDKDGSTMIAMAPGTLIDGAWEFVIPGEAVKGLKGRYSYCIGTEEKSLCFKKPLYLI